MLPVLRAAVEPYEPPLSGGLSNSNLFTSLSPLLGLSAKYPIVPSASSTVPGVFHTFTSSYCFPIYKKNLVLFLPFSPFFFLESSSFRTLPVGFRHTSTFLSLPSFLHPSRGLIHLVIWLMPLRGNSRLPSLSCYHFWSFPLPSN